MESIDRTRLAPVTGGTGPNRTTITSSDRTVSTSRTDYGYCVDTVTKACTDANTGFLGTNRSAAGACVVKELPKACPPSLSGGPQGQTQ